MSDNSMFNQNTDTDSSSWSFNEFLMLIRFNYKTILACALFFILISTYNSFSTTPEYMASTTLMIKEKATASLVMDFGGNRQRNQIINEIQLIQSRLVAEKVIDHLWKNGGKNHLYILGTRLYKPRGQRIRKLFKEIITLGFYDPSKDKAKVYKGQYTQDQLNVFSK